MFSIRIFSGGTFIVTITLWLLLLLLLRTTRCFPQFIHHFYRFRCRRLVRYGFGKCFFFSLPSTERLWSKDITITIMRFPICETTKLLLPMCNKNDDNNLWRDKGGKQSFFFSADIPFVTVEARSNIIYLNFRLVIVVVNSWSTNWRADSKVAEAFILCHKCWIEL